MEKYKQVFFTSISELIAYRLNFFLWRFRVVISILISYFLWTTVYSSGSSLFGYSRAEMVSYILLITILNAVVLSTQTFRVAQEIQNGSLSNFLLLPFNYVGFNLSRDLADKCVNIFLSIIELLLLNIVLKPKLVMPSSFLNLLLFIFSLLLAVGLYFCINMILSFIGFWSRESWAPRFIFSILVTFLAGTYFPLDIFPSIIYSFLRFLPFTYLIFFPLKIYLGKLTISEIFSGILISTVWFIVLVQVMNYFWKKGLRLYTAEGK